MRYIGIDVGFGYTKATDGIRSILFPSVISPPVKMGFRPFQGDRSDRHHFLINHLSVSLEGETFFVGNLALNQGRFTSPHYNDPSYLGSPYSKSPIIESHEDDL